jgi:predicted small integral membrane protein
MQNIKIILVAGVALFLTLAVLGNVTMPDLGTGAVKTAVGMQTTFQHPGAMWRAITNPALVYAIFGLIVLTEAVAAALCWTGAARMWGARKADPAAFHRAANLARVGLGVTAALYFIGWLVIANEWFEMWQSKDFNVVPDAFRIFASAMLILFLVGEREVHH